MSSQIGKEGLVTVSPPVGLLYDAFDRGPVYALINYLVRYFREEIPELRLSAESQGITVNFSSDFPADEENLPAVAFYVLSESDREDWLGGLLIHNARDQMRGNTTLTTVRADIWGRAPHERDMVVGRLRRKLKAARFDLKPKGVYDCKVRYSAPRGMDIEGTTWARRDQSAQVVRIFRHILDFLIVSEEGVRDPTIYDTSMITSITISEAESGVTTSVGMDSSTFGHTAEVTVANKAASDQECQLLVYGTDSDDQEAQIEVTV